MRERQRRGRAAAELLQTHPDYAIITGFPGLGDSTGARVRAEIGDDRARFADARALKAYAGSAPITRPPGRSRLVARETRDGGPVVHTVDLGSVNCNTAVI